MEMIPVNIISGFLGSGKTTAILKLLSQKNNDEQWAVIINEFGKISIDSQTISDSSEAGKVFEISGGCICCSAKGYFQENLEKILKEGNYSGIIIEPTGLGGIDMVSEIIKSNPELVLTPLLCLVDLTIIENPRLQLNPIYRNQISKSDVIVFSKCDLVTKITEKERLIKKFRTLFPDKHVYTDILSIYGFNALPDSNFIKEKRTNFQSVYPSFTDTNYIEKHYKFNSAVSFNSEKLSGLLNNHSAILRAKGHIQTEKGWVLVNFTLSGFSVGPCRPKECNEIVLIFEKKEPDLFLIPEDKDLLSTAGMSINSYVNIC